MIRKLYCAMGYNCNNRCRICAVDSKKALDSNMTTMQIVGYIKEKLDANPDIRIIEFSGGEPTIRKDFFEILEWVHENYPDKKYVVFSNGRRFSDAGYAERISYLPIESLNIAIHGKDALSHDLETQVKGSFVETMTGIQNLLIANIQPTIKIIPTRLNFRDIPDIVRMIITAFPDAKKMTINGLDVQGSAMENADEIFVKLSDAIPYIQQGLDIADLNGIDICTYSIPRCFFDEEHRRFVGYQPNVSYKYKSPSHDLEDKKDDNGYSQECEKCIYFKDCAGCWGTYIDYFGVSEIRPIMNPETGDNDSRCGKDIVIDVTGFCNNDCMFCLAGGSRQSGLAGEDIIKKIDDSGVMQGGRITLSGGEPTLCPDLFRIMEHIVSIGCSPSIITNGRMLKDKAYAKKLAEYCKMATIDLHGHEAGIHDSITRRKGSFDETVAGIRNMIEMGVAVRIKVMVNRINYMNLADIASFVSREFKGVTKIVFSSINVTGYAFDNKDEIVVKVSECMPYIEAAIDRCDEAGIDAEIDMYPYCVLDERYGERIRKRRDERVFLARDSDGTGLMFGEINNNKDGRFIKACEGCAYDKDCPKYWKRYVELYGADEFSRM